MTPVLGSKLDSNIDLGFADFMAEESSKKVRVSMNGYLRPKECEMIGLGPNHTTMTILGREYNVKTGSNLFSMIEERYEATP